MGLIELLIALTVLQIAIFAVFATLNAGGLALIRASRVSSATVAGDRQIELYRGLLYNDIGLSATELVTSATDATHTSESTEWSGVGSQVVPINPPSTWCLTTRPECSPMQTVTGPDGRNYRLDTYITSFTPPSGRSVKRVTVVVRRADDLTIDPLARVTANFDTSTGCLTSDPSGNNSC